MIKMHKDLYFSDEYNRLVHRCRQKSKVGLECNGQGLPQEKYAYVYDNHEDVGYVTNDGCCSFCQKTMQEEVVNCAAIYGLDLPAVQENRNPVALGVIVEKNEELTPKYWRYFYRDEVYSGTLTRDWPMAQIVPLAGCVNQTYG